MPALTSRLLRVVIISTVIVIGIAAVLWGARSMLAPRIIMEPSGQDLGEMPQQHLELTYTVRNEGRTDLRIDDVSTTCGCTKASVEQKTIPPGGLTLLHVTMDPQKDNLYGNLYRVITLRTNDPAAPEAKVDFHVIIDPPGG